MSELHRVRQVRPVSASGAVPNVLDGFAALTVVVKTAQEFAVLCQTERTNRERIETYAKTEIARIKGAEDILRRYFDHVFAERKSNFEELFKRLDDALEQRDSETVSKVLNGIVDIARSSPLADLGDLGQLRAALDDPDQVWEL